MFSTKVATLIFVFVQASQAFDCSTRKDGMYASTDDECTDVFWKCWGGNAFRYTCPNELYYRTDAEYCDYKEKVPNCREPKTRANKGNEEKELDFDCSAKSDGYHTRRLCREEQFYCDSGKPIRKNVTILEK